MDLANWVLWTSPKFTTEVKYQLHQGYDQIRDLKIPAIFRPILVCKYIIWFLAYLKFKTTKEKYAFK